MDQARLPEMPEPPAAQNQPRRPRLAPPKLKPINREQGILRPLMVEELVGPEHKVRAIWDLTGRLDLSGYLERIQSAEGAAGCSAWDPRLLLSVWVYAYSEEVTSAREIERMMAYEPGLMWLAGLGEVNHHTLSDFRGAYPQALHKVLTDFLAILSQEGYVKLELVAHDGTKIRTQGGSDQFRRKKTLAEARAMAQRKVAELEQAAEGEEKPNARRAAARMRAARERLARMEQAAEELQKIEAQKAECEKQQARVCLSEPEARLMKHGDHAMAPSYNLQMSTTAGDSFVVGMHLTQASSDSGALPQAMAEVQAATGSPPKAVVVDGGFTNRESIVAMKAAEIEMYGSLVAPEVRQAASMKAAGIDPAFGPAAFVALPGGTGEAGTLRCPAGQTLDYVGQSRKREDLYARYRAAAADCGGCPFQKQCCPKHAHQGRMVSIRMTENAEVAALREKMKTPEAQAIYKRRGPVAEFPNAWLKEKFGLRKFRMRGLKKATCEAMMAVLTYNIMQWRRLSWLPKQTVAEAV